MCPQRMMFLRADLAVYFDCVDDVSAAQSSAPTNRLVILKHSLLLHYQRDRGALTYCGTGPNSGAGSRYCEGIALRLRRGSAGAASGKGCSSRKKQQQAKNMAA